MPKPGRETLRVGFNFSFRHNPTPLRGEIEKDEFSVDAGEWLEALGSTTFRANTKPILD